MKAEIAFFTSVRIVRNTSDFYEFNFLDSDVLYIL